MKKLWTIAIALVLTLGFCSCGKSETSKTENSSSVNPTETTNDIDEIDKTDYSQLAKDFALQMSQGDFDQTWECFSSDLKTRLDKESLKNAWEQTVATIGEYIGFYDVTILKNGNINTATAILKYDKSGLSVKFTFSLDKIEGIWLNYYTLPNSSENYDEKNIKIGELELDGLLTIPKNVENPPVAILIQGSGQSDMNESIGVNTPFKDIAHGLADKGIATIRYNKRYYQYPEKASDNITIYDEVIDDVMWAVAYAKECKSVNSNKIIIIGHSLGGMLAPKICAENGDISGMISLAGSPRSLENIIYDQNAILCDKQGLSDIEKETLLSPIKDEVNKIKKITADDNENYLGINAAYWYSLNQSDSKGLAKELTIPMLFMQGSADFQVFADKDFTLWQETLANKDNVTFKLYDNLNHLFMSTNGKNDQSEYAIAGNVNENVLNDISNWINGLN